MVQAALKSPVVPNLAIDPNAARLDAAQLHLVDQRIANLKKAIALLGDSNPEWARERDHVLDDMHDTRLEISWETVNLMSLGFAEWAKRMAKTNVADAAKNVLLKSLKESLADLPSEEARLDQIMATTKDIRLTKAILEYKGALQRLRDAQHARHVVEIVARARDAADMLKSEFDLMKTGLNLGNKVADELYMSSAFVGGVAVLFVASPIEAAAATTGSVLSSVAVGGRAAVNLWKERAELAALNQDASRRNRLRVELTSRLQSLEQEHDRLVASIQRAAPIPPR